MKIRLIVPVLALLGLCPVLSAQPLSRDATVYARPDPAAAVLRVLQSGTVPTPALAPVEPAPEGWAAVEVPGPHQVFVENRNVGKNLDVKPGAGLRLKPEAAAPVVAVMEAGDRTELAGLAGPRRDWSQYRLEKPIVGYIKLPSALATVSSAPAAPPLPTGPAVSADSGRAPMPRFFEGRFAAAENFLTYRHPYKYQLLDSAGDRFAYLDASRLLLTDDPSRYVGHTVVVYGTARTINETGTKRVIEVESLQLK